MTRLPKSGVCPNNNSHQITRVLSSSKLFIKDQQCSKCLSPFDKTKYNGYYVQAHYYQCKKCPSKICFQCAQPAQIDGNRICWSWRKHRLPGPSRSTMEIAPAINTGWLKVNDALSDISDRGLNAVLGEVIKLFGGTRKLLQIITKSASRYDLQSIYRLILKHQRESGQSERVQRNKLESLPEEMHSNILGYLNRENIKDLKMCSRRMSILCLAEMKKITIGYIDSDKLMKFTNPNPTDLSSFVVRTRYNHKKTQISLNREWSQKSSIPKENQIFFSYVDTPRSSYYGNIFFIYLPLEYRRNNKIMNNGLILDKTKIVSLTDPSNPRLFGENSSGHNLIVLQYFDLSAQSMKVVQYLVYKRNNKNNLDNKYDEIVGYVLNHFIKVDGMDNEWHHKMMRIVNQMNDDPNEAKLCIYCTRTSGRGRSVPDRVCTLYINPKHPWFIANRLKLIKANDIDNVADICPYTIEISFRDRELLSECIQKYYAKRLKKNELRIFKPQIDTILDFINAKSIKLSVKDKDAENRIKQKICKALDSVIKPSQLGRYGVLGYDTKYFVVFRFSGNKDKYDCPHHVNVYTPSNCPYPYQDEKNKKIVPFMYRKDFNPDELVKDLFETISKSPDHIYYDYCKELVDAYYADGIEEGEDDDCDLICDGMERKLNENIQCVLHEDDESFNLFMTPIIRQPSEESIKLKIRFTAGKKWKYFGLPLDVWIRKEDTLQFIVNKYLKKIRKFIQKCYKIKENKQKVLIQRYKWIDFDMSQKMNIVFKVDERQEETNITLVNPDLIR